MTHDLGVTVRLLRASALGHNGMVKTGAVCLYDMEAHDCEYHQAAL